MKRNPFLKEDKGFSFLCYLMLFGGVQAIYYTFYIDPVFFRDFRLDLIDLAIEMGYSYDEKTGNYRPIIGSNSPLLQKDNFLKNKDKLWVPAVIF